MNCNLGDCQSFKCGHFCFKKGAHCHTFIEDINMRISLEKANNTIKKADVHMGEASRSEALRYDGNPIIKEVTNMAKECIETNDSKSHFYGTCLTCKFECPSHMSNEICQRHHMLIGFGTENKIGDEKSCLNCSYECSYHRAGETCRCSNGDTFWGWEEKIQG